VNHWNALVVVDDAHKAARATTKMFLVRTVHFENPTAPVLGFSAVANSMDHTVNEKLVVAEFAFHAHVPHCLGSFSSALDVVVVHAADDENCDHYDGPSDALGMCRNVHNYKLKYFGASGLAISSFFEVLKSTKRMTTRHFPLLV
jgi:hypothetical protein